MSFKKWFSWPLPFKDECDPHCEYDLHNCWCFAFPVMFVVLSLALIGYLRMNQEWMLFSLVILWLLFGATWKLQGDLVVRYWCRKCLQAGGPVCLHCGGKIGVRKGYIFHSFLSLTICGMEIRKCERCGYELN